MTDHAYRKIAAGLNEALERVKTEPMPIPWPDPSRPGVPPESERDGWHWLQDGDADPEVFQWDAGPPGFGLGCWLRHDRSISITPEQVVEWGYRHLSRVAEPGEVEAKDARITAAITALQAAPDLLPDQPAGRARVAEIVRANDVALAILREGCDPPSVRQAPAT